jgi:DNA-binding CsgD family transcriptional regulator
VGAWDAADADANESIAIGLEFGQGTMLTFSWSQLVRLDAVRGNGQECLERAHAVYAAAEETDVRSVKVQIDAAVGLLYLGLGQLERAIDHFETVERELAAYGVGELAITMSLPNLIEAYVRAGRRREAAEQLERLDETATRTQRRWTTACAARCHGLLTTTDFHQEFERALTVHAQLPSSFDRAQTELCYGERLRRAGLRIDARDRLRSALATFDSLGATGWARHATAEIEATGEHVAPRRLPPSTELTAQELQIARLVAAGASNREVAATLFLSTKTVEHHLTNAYRKAGVRSRTQLARIVHEQTIALEA